jgi:hypothetical protein
VWKDVRNTEEQMRRICSVFHQNTSDLPREERDANAALIAAAPDLLAACEAALADLRSTGADDGEVGEQLKAAITKARAS